MLRGGDAASTTAEDDAMATMGQVEEAAKKHKAEQETKLGTTYGPFGSRLLDMSRRDVRIWAADQIWEAAPTLGQNDSFRKTCASDGTVAALVEALKKSNDDDEMKED